jgi:soluble lytic murein transglycosylase-like protein
MLISTVLAIAFTGFSTGKLHINLSNFSSASPYSVVEQLEENYFSSLSLKSNYQKRLDQAKVIARISEVMSNYKTGLNDSNKQSVPRMIVEQSQKYAYDPLFLTALIVTESSFYNWAESDQGALGLMQIRPGTGIVLASETQMRWEGIPSLYNPGVNIALGAYYLSKLVSRYGDLGLALEAYNYGPTKLDGYLRSGHRPQVYSKRVLALYNDLRTQAI